MELNIIGINIVRHTEHGLAYKPWDITQAISLASNYKTLWIVQGYFYQNSNLA